MFHSIYLVSLEDGLYFGTLTGNEISCEECNLKIKIDQYTFCINEPVVIKVNNGYATIDFEL